MRIFVLTMRNRAIMILTKGQKKEVRGMDLLSLVLSVVPGAVIGWNLDVILARVKRKHMIKRAPDEDESKKKYFKTFFNFIG